ncbi:MAG: InlB B-repeat-containing protein [Firmicutes bacterium]|nr:InlB B-repeat-containing protein [Bacillota bacterium]
MLFGFGIGSNRNGVNDGELDKPQNIINFYREEINLFVLTLDPNGGSGYSDTMSVEYGSPMPTPSDGDYQLMIPSKEGCIFDGYWDTANQGGKQYYGDVMQSVNDWDKMEDATLYARWISKYTVTLDSMGGVRGTKSTIGIYGYALDTNLNPPIRATYRFVGYFNKVDGDDAIQYYDQNMNSLRAWDIQGDATLYARWTSASFEEGFGWFDYNDNAGLILSLIGGGSALGIVGCLTFLYILKKKRKRNNTHNGQIVL